MVAVSKNSEIKNKIPSITGLTTITVLNAKVIYIWNKITDITNIAHKAALNAKATEIESKISDTSHFTIIKNSSN